MQERRNSIANALELRLSRTNPSNGTFLKRPLLRVVLYERWYLIWEDVPVAFPQEWGCKTKLHMLDKHVLLHREGFQLSTSSQCWKKERKCKYFAVFSVLSNVMWRTTAHQTDQKSVQVSWDFYFQFFFTSCFSLHHDLSALSFFSHTLFWWVIVLEIYLQCCGDIKITPLHELWSYVSLALTYWEFHNNFAFNMLKPEQNGRHFTDDISRCISLNENDCILIPVSLKTVSMVSVNNKLALV